MKFAVKTVKILCKNCEHDKYFCENQMTRNYFDFLFCFVYIFCDILMTVVIFESIKINLHIMNE